MVLPLLFIMLLSNQVEKSLFVKIPPSFSKLPFFAAVSMIEVVPGAPERETGLRSRGDIDFLDNMFSGKIIKRLTNTHENTLSEREAGGGHPAPAGPWAPQPGALLRGFSAKACRRKT